jgi:hypothetical protein
MNRYMSTKRVSTAYLTCIANIIEMLRTRAFCGYVYIELLQLDYHIDLLNCEIRELAMG